MKKIFNHFLLISMVCATSMLLKASEAPLIPSASLERKTSAQKPYRDSHWGTQLADLEKAIHENVSRAQLTKGYFIKKTLTKLAQHPKDQQKSAIFVKSIKNMHGKAIGNLWIRLPQTMSEKLQYHVFIDYFELERSHKDLYEFAKGFNEDEPFNSPITQQKWYVVKENTTITGLQTCISSNPLGKKSHMACAINAIGSAQKALEYISRHPKSFVKKNKLKKEKKKKKNPYKYVRET